MALVFKIKFQDTLRRWVVSSSEMDYFLCGVTPETFSLTLAQLHAKIRELFQIHPDASFKITYVDQENDVVTLGNDQDLMDACLVQRLNPLRLHVQLVDVKPEPSPEESPVENVNIETILKALFPQATLDNIHNFLKTHTEFVHPKLTTELLNNAEKAFKEVLNNLAAGPPQSKPDEKSSASYQPKERNVPGQGNSGGDRVFHWGVECDGCGMLPIEGVRYKSTKKYDYDLCTICFDAANDQAEYQKIEYPIAHTYHGSWGHVARSPFQGHQQPPFRRGPRPFSLRPAVCRGSFSRGPYGLKPDTGPIHQYYQSFISNEDSKKIEARIGRYGRKPDTGLGQQSCQSFSAVDDSKKMDARFVKDITVFDGTELAPGTKFTKIWRVSNIGTPSWPQGIQLVHIGGDSLCNEDVVNVEIPGNGLASGEDVDISIDLVAPEKAGRYVSHWRLMAPLGQRFGQRLWVVIQVVPQDEESPQVEESLRNSDDEHLDDKKAKESESVSAGLPDLLIFENENKSNEPVVYPPTEDRAITDVDNVNAGLENDNKSNETVVYPPTEDKITTNVDDINAGLENEKKSNETVVYPPAEDRVITDADTINTDTVSAGLESMRLEDEKFEVVGLPLKGQATGPEEEISEIDGFSLVAKPDEGATLKEAPAAGEDEITDSVLVNKVESIEELSLKYLESMGFTNANLNLQLLQKNKNDIENTIEDLLTASGWDGALKDLEEMGFTDQARNIRLLARHGGSIKQVVRVLVKSEKAAA